MEQADRLRCSECNEFLINTEHYATCPNMHGRLRQKLSPADLRLIEATKLPVVQSTGKPGEHYLDGNRVRAIRRCGLFAAIRRFAAGEKIVARCSAFKKGFGVFELSDPQ